MPSNTASLKWTKYTWKNIIKQQKVSCFLMIITLLAALSSRSLLKQTSSGETTCLEFWCMPTSILLHRVWISGGPGGHGLSHQCLLFKALTARSRFCPLAEFWAAASGLQPKVGLVPHFWRKHSAQESWRVNSFFLKQKLAEVSCN